MGIKNKNEMSCKKRIRKKVFSKVGEVRKISLTSAVEVSG